MKFNDIQKIIVLIFILCISCSGNFDIPNFKWGRYWQSHEDCLLVHDAGINSTEYVYVVGANANNCSDDPKSSLNTQHSSTNFLNCFNSHGDFKWSMDLWHNTYWAVMSDNELFIIISCYPGHICKIGDKIVFNNQSDDNTLILVRIISDSEYNVERLEYEGLINNIISDIDVDTINRIYIAANSKTCNNTRQALFENGPGISSLGIISPVDCGYSSIILDNIIITDIATDSDSNVIAIGSCYINNDFDPSDLTYSVDTYTERSFIAKYNADLELQWVIPDINGNLVETDYNNNIYLLRNGSYQVINDNGIGKYSVSLPGNINDIVLDNGYVYLAGNFSHMGDFDPTNGVFNMVPTGQADAFLVKLDFNGAFVNALSWGSSSFNDQAYSVTSNNGVTIVSGVGFNNNSYLFQFEL